MPGTGAIAVAPAKSETETPVIPRSPARPPAESPGHRIPIPNAPDPRWVVITRTIDHYTVFHLRSQVARRVTFVHIIRLAAINAHVGHVMQGRTGGNGINHGRNEAGHGPRPVD